MLGVYLAEGACLRVGKLQMTASWSWVKKKKTKQHNLINLMMKSVMISQHISLFNLHSKYVSPKRLLYIVSLSVLVLNFHCSSF